MGGIVGRQDVAYDQKSRPWQQVDRLLDDGMRCGGGGGAVEAKTFYYALYRHGRHWKFRRNSRGGVSIHRSESGRS
jgi:hypothetical protein